MRGDIVARLSEPVVAQAVAERVEQPHRPLRARDIAEADRIGRKQFKQRHRVGGRPFARRPRLIPADRTRTGQMDQRHPAVEPDHRDRAGGMKADAALGPVGQRRLEPAALKPLIELIEHARE